MISRRQTLTLFLATLPCPAGPFDKLAARWRSRITVIRSGRPLNTRLRLTFTAAGSFVIEEYATGGQLAWLYKGAARLNDPNGAAADPGRARYDAGETYNLGAVEYISAARVRIGALELQKELE